MQKTVYAFVFLLLLTDILIIGFNVQLVGATGTIYIRADGSIDPPTAPISTLDNVTYTLTGDITSSTDCLTILRNNIIVDGNGHTLQGSGNGTGIYLPPGWENVTVRNTQIGGFEFGIYVFSSSSNSIVGNSISANVYEGIIIENSSNDRISENSVASTFGIELRRANNERVSGNNMANGNWSIYLYSSSSNSIIGNSITANNYGIVLDNSSNNGFWHNNFTGNVHQVSAGGNNVWDDGYPSGGNFWSDYNGTDFFSGPYQNVTGSDGIGDTPYVIDANNTDHYPLMQPSTGAAPTSTHITLSVNLVSVGTLVNCTASVSGLNPTGTVTWSTDSIAGSFFQSVCTLSNGSCSTTYVDNFTGCVTIAAYYSGDSNNLPSSGSTTLIVTSAGPVYYSKNYVSVQAAINAAPPGATVIAASGYYSESLTVNERLTIIGEKDPPIFSGRASGTCLTLLSGASGSTVTGIVITNYSKGILVVNASDCQIYCNIMASLGDSGIVLEGSAATDNGIYNNVFQDTPTAIAVTGSAVGNTISGNTICSQATVTLSVGADDTRVYGNVMSGNQIVVNATNSEGNVIYHNNFLAAVQITVLATGSNAWDNGYPSGGNYWSSYVGVDEKSGSYQNVTGSDSIGDTPYTIATNNTDRYPLMKPWNLTAGHSVAVISVMTDMTVIGQGFNCNVTVYAANNGEYAETFSVTVYANTAVVGTQQVSNLNATCPLALTFTWNTTGLAKGNYTMTAYAGPVPGQTSIADNNLAGAMVYVGIPGDVNGDGTVNILDAIMLSNAFGASPGSPRWNPNADINHDGVINILDAIILSNHFLQHYP